MWQMALYMTADGTTKNHIKCKDINRFTVINC